MTKLIVWSTKGHHPWIVIGLWLAAAAVVVALPRLASVTSNDSSRALPASAESRRADALVQSAFPDAQGTPIIVVYSSPKALTAADKGEVMAGLTSLESHPSVSSVRPQFSPDGKGALLFATLSGNPGLESFRDDVAAIRDQFGERAGSMEVRVTGPGGLVTDAYQIFLHADLRLLVGTLILVLVLLLIIYRSPILPFVPLLTVGVAYWVAGGILASVADARGATLSGQATSLMVILLFGAGTDYGLLLIARYREFLHSERDARTALGKGLAGTWEAIAASGLTVTLAILTLTFARYGDYRSFGPVLAAGVFVTLIAGLTLMPALLAVLGRKAFWPRTPKEGAATSHAFWERLAKRVTAAPGRAAALVVVILALLALGTLAMEFRFSFTDDFLTSTPSAQGYTLLERHFPSGQLAPTTVLVKYPSPPASATTGAIAAALEASPGVQAAIPTGASENGTLHRYQVIYEGDPYAASTLEDVRELRLAARAAAAAGGTVLVGGPTAIQADTWALSNRDTLLVGAIALFLVAVILAVLLRALVAPAFLLATNLLSYLAALGATVLITEKVFGWGAISYRIPLYLFIFLVALGSDYNIFITTRIRSEALASGLLEGTKRAITATGGVLTSAGIILAGTFLILTSQPVKDLVEIAIGVALGVLLDTFLVRTALVPGLTLVVGPNSGWPGRRWTKESRHEAAERASGTVSAEDTMDPAASPADLT